MSIEKVMVDNRRKYVQILSKHPAKSVIPEVAVNFKIEGLFSRNYSKG